MNNNFSQWLLSMMNEKQWSQAELARRSGLSRTSISYVISGQANPGDALCRAIAKAFQLPIDDVYRVAGLLPVKPIADETVSEITHIYHELDEDKTRATIRGLVSRVIARRTDDQITGVMYCNQVNGQVPPWGSEAKTLFHLQIPIRKYKTPVKNSP